MKEDFIKRSYSQEDLDKALHQGYKIAQEQYSTQIKKLKEELKEALNGKGKD